MRQADLNREVAQATGETVSIVKRLGFLLDDPFASTNPDSKEMGPLVIDWDELESQRHAASSWEQYAPATV